MRYLRNHSTDPYFNMAFDEYALECLTLDEPLFFLWQNSPAVIVGLNQNVYAEVDMDYLCEHDIALVRRVTGGGAVYHDLGNLNYTIVGRSADLHRDYPGYTRLIQQALQALGVDASLSGRNDILVDGRKVSGFAKRVYKDRLMVHGTLMYDVDLSVLERVLSAPTGKMAAKGVSSVRSRVMNLRECLPQVHSIGELRDRLEHHLSRGYADKELLLSEADLQHIAHLARTKFASPQWIYGHRMPAAGAVVAVDVTDSPHAMAAAEDVVRKVHHVRHLSCGTVEVTLEVDEGYISSCRIGGDFIGNLPASGIEDALVGVRYEREALRQRLLPLGVANYFDGLSVDEFCELIIRNGSSDIRSAGLCCNGIANQKSTVPL